MLDKEIGHLLDWYNFQFYNQGDTTYDTYERLFVKANGYFTGTSVGEIAALGVPLQKIVIGKPCTPADATNTGYVSSSSLATFSSQAYTAIGWNAGVMTW